MSSFSRKEFGGDILTGEYLLLKDELAQPKTVPPNWQLPADPTDWITRLLGMTAACLTAHATYGRISIHQYIQRTDSQVTLGIASRQRS